MEFDVSFSKNTQPDRLLMIRNYSVWILILRLKHELFAHVFKGNIDQLIFNKKIAYQKNIWNISLKHFDIMSLIILFLIIVY